MYLFHGVLEEVYESMKENGVNPESYWGDEFEAIRYTDCDKLIKIDPEKYTVIPNHTIIDHYISEGSDPDVIRDWEESGKKWQDSLRIFGSVIIEERVFFDEDFDIVSKEKGNWDLY